MLITFEKLANKNDADTVQCRKPMMMTWKPTSYGTLRYYTGFPANRFQCGWGSPTCTQLQDTLADSYTRNSALLESLDSDTLGDGRSPRTDGKKPPGQMV